MEQRAKPKKQYQSASYVTGSTVFYGTLLFLIARFFSFVQLFADAYNRNQLNQAPPENFTFFGILGSLMVLSVITLTFVLLLRCRRRMTRLRRGNLYLLLNVLFVAWGLIQAISYFVEMVLFFEFVYLLDFVALITALVVPSVLLQLADRMQEPAQDTALLVSAISATALSVIAALIVSLVLRKSYTTLQLVRELMFRAGILLFGIAGLQKAMKLRSEPIAYIPKPKPEPKIKEPKIKEHKPDKRGRVECPDCGKKLNPDVERCPRCGFDMSIPSLFDDDDDEFDIEENGLDDATSEPEIPAEEAPLVEETTQPEPQKPTHVDTCPRCGKNIPPFLTTCPHCGYYPGDPLELPKEPEKQRPVPPPIPTVSTPEAHTADTTRTMTRCRNSPPFRKIHMPPTTSNCSTRKSIVPAATGLLQRERKSVRTADIRSRTNRPAARLQPRQGCRACPTRNA
jgi:ribosomal protein L37E